MSSQLIVYACPTGPLAEQLARYWLESSAHCGDNGAHDYMPHCSLTGFFSPQSLSIPQYSAILDRLYQSLRRSHSSPVVSVNALLFRPNWHGLDVESPWLQTLMAQFAYQASPVSDPDRICPKEWLHLSLAYDFDDAHTDQLKALARTLIDPTAPVGWELRFYERHRLHQWTCHSRWELDAVPMPNTALSDPIS
jgi:ubiquitin-associated SH3 domain-containing protein